MQPVPVLARYSGVRDATQLLVAGLEAEDMVIQTMPDVSPTKWHLAHTTWFWETFLLRPYLPGYREFSSQFNYLFNSYYNQIGARHARDERGFLSRPTLDDVLAYRVHVDEAMSRLLAIDHGAQNTALRQLVELGLAHEEQHQELILTDIKHVLSHHPFAPAAFAGPAGGAGEADAGPCNWIGFDGGVVEVGADEDRFHFDNEGPRHQAILTPFALADRLVTNRDYLAFVEDGGYRSAGLWLSDGWAQVEALGWTSPLYWRKCDGRWEEFTLHGQQALDPDMPVIHLSYYEASAFAEWSGARLPDEREWEHGAATRRSVDGRLCRPGQSAHPAVTPAHRAGGAGPRQMFGDAWEWTRSAYSPYPRYRPAPGAVGEYNGKFMCGQFVLRGGSCATAPGHVRTTYRNFFPPATRWQFSGVRLAKDI
ncbi:ergothioneine biosynthesis protein EgtB [Maricaulis sp.]|uniref:ergothioneine biosynthesis protein EgtB n=1 Tax=Maricaulis sp. TaxID=1486257 RepID=UPI002B26574B|nr:ergothioneine biosynthesis protein EgtB [Maricaulis sp.]